MDSPWAAIAVSLFYLLKKLPESFKYNLACIKAVYHKGLRVLTEMVLVACSSKSSVDFWSSVPVTTVSDQGPTCLVIQFIQQTWLRVLVVPNFCYITIIEDTVLLGILKALKWFYTLALIHSSPQNFIVEVYIELHWLHNLAFVLTCSVNFGALYTYVCAFSQLCPIV